MLDPAHAELLRASAISLEVVEARGYFSAHTKAEVERLGFGRNQARPGLLIPQWNVLGECTHHQLRPNERREIKGKLAKYETPTKATQTLDVPPGARERLDDVATPLIVTEGSRKADAAVSRGMCAISVNGVYGWRGTNDKSGKTALPDWEQIALNGRTVVLAFDSDAMTKREVHQALGRLAGFLRMRHARVVFGYLPPDPSGRKTGLDDWLAANATAGYAELEQLCRPELDDLDPQQPGEKFDDVDDEPGWVVLGEVRDFVERHVHFSSEHHSTAVALWIAHTHAIAGFDFTPRLHARSAVKRSGKSRLLEVLEQLARRGVQAVNISPAVVFRMMEAEQPTILIDEVDQLLGDDRADGEPSPLIGLINGGFRRGNQVFRMVGQGADMKYQAFSVFGPVALAGIGRVVDTIADRSITVNLERMPSGVTVEGFRHRDVVETTTALRRRLAAWASRNAEKLAAARPSMPDGIVDRAADIWEPLLSCAEVAGGDWDERARAASLHMVAVHLLEDSDVSMSVRLLADILELWPVGGTRWRSRDMVAALNEADDAPWADLRRGAGVTTYWLGDRLRPFGVKPKNVRTGGSQGKGYEREDFEPVWARYGVGQQEPDTRRDDPSRPTDPTSTPQPGGWGDESGRRDGTDALDGHGDLVDGPPPDEFEEF